MDNKNNDILTPEEIQSIEADLKDPFRISWAELRLYTKVRHKLESHNVEYV